MQVIWKMTIHGRQPCCAASSPLFRCSKKGYVSQFIAMRSWEPAKSDHSRDTGPKNWRHQPSLDAKLQVEQTRLLKLLLPLQQIQRQRCQGTVLLYLHHQEKECMKSNTGTSSLSCIIATMTNSTINQYYDYHNINVLNIAIYNK